MPGEKKRGRGGDLLCCQGEPTCILVPLGRQIIQSTDCAWIDTYSKSQSISLLHILPFNIFDREAGKQTCMRIPQLWADGQGQGPGTIFMINSDVCTQFLLDNSRCKAVDDSRAERSRASQ